MVFLLRFRAAAIALAIVAGLSGICPASTSSAGAELETLASRSLGAFMEGSYDVLLRRDPDSLWDAEGRTAVAYGVESYATLTDISPDALAETHRIEAEILQLLHGYQTASLTEEDQLSYDAYEWLLEDRLASAPYDYWDYCIGPSTYGVQNRQLELFNILPVRDLEDAHDYVARLRGMGAWMSQLLEGLRLREREGYVPTRTMVQMAEGEITAGILQEDAANPDPEALDAYITFCQRLADLPGITAADRDALQANAAAAIRDVVVPAFRALRAYLVGLEAEARDEVGLTSLPGGADYYTYALHHYVGTSATAEDLHALGLAEVAKLTEELRTLGASAFGWPRDLPMSELNSRIQNAKTEYLEGEELLARYRQLLAQAWDAYDRFFTARPTSDVVFSVDPAAPPAYYQAPPFDLSSPGLCVASLQNAALSTLYDDAVLMHHETVPGHHIQIGLALDGDFPTFRKAPIGTLYTQHPAFQAFTEGWALYGQQLAAEMGLYADDSVGHLWQVRLELTQVVRLVADTGMNALGWTWQEAATYLESALGVKQRQSVALRYESAPGQACGYSIGYITLLSLRQRAEDRLGDAFDIREFHEAVLRHGALPLEILERAVDAWIEASAPKP